MSTLFSLHQKLQRFINWVIGLALMVLLTIILLQTFTRYVIFYSLPWSEELSRYLFVLMILLGINIGITRENFVRIDVIDNFLPARMKPIMGVFRDLVALVVAIIFTYSTLPMIRIGKFQKSPALQLPMNWMYMILFIGFALAVVSIVLKILSRFTAKPAREGE